MTHKRLISVIVVCVTLAFSMGVSAQAIHVTPSGDVGFGTNSPSTALHILKSGGSLPRILLDNGDSTQDYFIDVSDNGDLRWSILGSNKQEFMIDGPTGNVSMSDNLIVGGTISSGGQTLTVPDYVFEKDYDLMPIEELAAYVISQKHLPEIAPAAEINENGINLSEFQMQLLKKVEELTLYTLQQDQQIRELADELKYLQKTSYDSTN